MKRERTLGFLIKTLDNLFFRNMLAYEINQEYADEVTVMHGWILGFLYENSNRDIFQKDIEKEFSIARSTVTCIVKLMEKKGYICRESVESDARLKRLVLTERGRQIHEQHISHLDKLERQCRRNITEEEMQVFLTVAEKLKQNLTEDIAAHASSNSKRMTALYKELDRCQTITLKKED
ncbi:MAG: MarR family transcriptional regulator [Lachnospiraceae bacterium]|nr:MarR family transcriptional regulator [Lachnospiraceae bacterium]